MIRFLSWRKLVKFVNKKNPLYRKEKKREDLSRLKKANKIYNQGIGAIEHLFTVYISIRSPLMYRTKLFTRIGRPNEKSWLKFSPMSAKRHVCVSHANETAEKTKYPDRRSSVSIVNFEIFKNNWLLKTQSGQEKNREILSVRNFSHGQPNFLCTPSVDILPKQKKLFFIFFCKKCLNVAFWPWTRR